MLVVSMTNTFSARVITINNMVEHTFINFMSMPLKTGACRSNTGVCRTKPGAQPPFVGQNTQHEGGGGEGILFCPPLKCQLFVEFYIAESFLNSKYLRHTAMRICCHDQS